MATGYVRQSAANIAAGLPIQSADINAEYNQLQSAFDNTTGHDHSGSASGTGAKIALTTAVTGLLPIANGGTNNNVAYTSGSVIFSNGTKLTENNSNLFWNDSTHTLQVGATVDTKTSYKINSSLFADTFSGSTRLYDPEAHAGILIGDTTGSGSNLTQFKNETHKFQNRAGTNTHAIIDTNGIDSKGAFYIDAILFGDDDTLGAHRLYDPEAHSCLSLGDTTGGGSSLNLHRNETHTFKNRAGTTTFAIIDNTGIHNLAGALAIADGGTGATTQSGAFNNIVIAAQSIGANGYIKFPSGFIIQWGSAIFVASTAVTVTFPLAFPTNVWNVQVSRKGAAGAANDCNWDNVSTTQVDITTDANFTGTAYWFAIGN